MSIFSPPVNPEPGAENFETIQSGKEIRIERIISKGQKSPPGFWYDQEENEWVMLVTGYAELEFEHGITTLKPGDYINIPAGVKHRVSFTSETEETVWLAVFYK
ncbi:MAG: cupin domain-containing protein [Ignavibacteriaceae bacterium]|nr:cupin domain-containing protein [Ignavibacteriaceae bacterium]